MARPRSSSALPVAGLFQRVRLEFPRLERRGGEGDALHERLHVRRPPGSGVPAPGIRAAVLLVPADAERLEGPRLDGDLLIGLDGPRIRVRTHGTRAHFPEVKVLAPGL